MESSKARRFALTVFLKRSDRIRLRISEHSMAQPCAAPPNIMQLHKYHPRFAGCLLAAALVTLFPACKPQGNSKATPVIDAHLQSFFADKEQQARELSRADGSEM